MSAQYFPLPCQIDTHQRGHLEINVSSTSTVCGVFDTRFMLWELHLRRHRPGRVEEGADVQQRSVRVYRVYGGDGDAPLAGLRQQQRLRIAQAQERLRMREQDG